MSVKTTIVSGNSYSAQAYMYSTRINHNGPVSYTVKNADDTTTDKATVSSSAGWFKALKPGRIKLIVTYPGAPYIWYWYVTIEPAGCKEYYYIQEESTISYKINCHGYAFGTNDIPSGWYTTEDYIDGFACETSNELLYGTNSFEGYKELLENNWLDVKFAGKWEEVYSDNNGMDIELEDNQWLVVFRVGIYGSSQDYHFWYRTDTGQWANKHGWRTGSGSELLDDLPSKDNSLGWSLGEITEFYDSDIIYYVMTEGD